jgi:hypothetical protein
MNQQGGQPGNPSSQRNPADNSTKGGSKNRSQQGSRGSRQKRQSPNPQTGRPEPGNSTPQVSQETERKVKQALGTQESVSDQRDDLEELKAQNKQIIDLLKRINQNVNNL